jgi:flagellin-like protein
MNYKKLRKNVKAVSPVISVLLMIAVAVAASLVTYAWVMGYMGFTTNKVGKAIQIQSVSRSNVYVQNVGTSQVTLTSFYVNGVLDPSPTISPAVLNPSDTATITSTIPWTTAQNVTVKVVSSDGTFAEFTKTFP